MNPEIIYCQQQSEEWFITKLGLVSASHFSDVLAKGQGKTRNKYMLRLIAEILSGNPQESYTNDAMQWGIDTEPFAREYYENYYKVKVEQVGLIRLGDTSCSPDGLVGDEGGLEIKCPDTTTHLKYILDNQLPSEYIPQVQGGLYVSGRKWWDFVSFDPRIKRRPFWCIRIERDEKYIDNLKYEIDKFIKEMNELKEKIECPL